MKQLKMLHYPDPILNQRAEPIVSFGEEEARLAQLMIEIMHAEGGVGLAAPQIGISKQIFIANPAGKEGRELVFVNVRILESWGEQLDEEGCLSLPGITGNIRRSKELRYERMDEAGNIHAETATDFLARIIQHEMDHLNGKLIIDRMDFDRRQKLLDYYRAKS